MGRRLNDPQKKEKISRKLDVSAEDSWRELHDKIFKFFAVNIQLSMQNDVFIDVNDVVNSSVFDC